MITFSFVSRFRITGSTIGFRSRLLEHKEASFLSNPTFIVYACTLSRNITVNYIVQYAERITLPRETKSTTAAGAHAQNVPRLEREIRNLANLPFSSSSWVQDGIIRESFKSPCDSPRPIPMTLNTGQKLDRLCQDLKISTMP